MGYPFGPPSGLPPNPIHDPIGSAEWITRHNRQQAEAALAAGQNRQSPPPARLDLPAELERAKRLAYLRERVEAERRRAHDAAVAANATRFGPAPELQRRADQIAVTLARRPRRLGTLSVGAALALMLAAWYTRSWLGDGRWLPPVPTWIPLPRRSAPTPMLTGGGLWLEVVAVAAACVVAVGLLQRVTSARAHALWPAKLAMLAVVPLSYLIAWREGWAEWIPAPPDILAVQDAALWMGGVGVLLAVIVANLAMRSYTRSRMRRRQRLIELRATLLEHAGCGRPGCRTCRAG